MVYSFCCRIERTVREHLMTLRSRFITRWNRHATRKLHSLLPRYTTQLGTVWTSFMQNWNFSHNFYHCQKPHIKLFGFFLELPPVHSIPNLWNEDTPFQYMFRILLFLVSRPLELISHCKKLTVANNLYYSPYSCFYMWWWYIKDFVWQLVLQVWGKSFLSSSTWAQYWTGRDNH